MKRLKNSWKLFVIMGSVAILLLAFVSFQIYKAVAAPDAQCLITHHVSPSSPSGLITAMDYFNRGNYEYDQGNCKEAIADYTKSIDINPDYAQSYNNRAYTFMRMQDYQDALPDLNKAIALNPGYIQALMNRGDIYNYYFAVDRQKAMIDYKKVIALGGVQGTSVCGHLMLAKHDGWNVGTILDIPQALKNNCQ